MPIKSASFIQAVDEFRFLNYIRKRVFHVCQILSRKTCSFEQFFTHYENQPSFIYTRMVFASGLAQHGTASVHNLVAILYERRIFPETSSVAYRTSALGT